MSFELKSRLLKFFKNDNTDTDDKIQITKSELEKMVNDRAAELLDKELKSLDNEFLLEVSKTIKPVKVGDVEEKQETKTAEEQVAQILKEE